MSCITNRWDVEISLVLLQISRGHLLSVVFSCSKLNCVVVLLSWCNIWMLSKICSILHRNNFAFSNMEINLPSVLGRQRLLHSSCRGSDAAIDWSSAINIAPFSFWEIEVCCICIKLARLDAKFKRRSEHNIKFLVLISHFINWEVEEHWSKVWSTIHLVISHFCV